jgi:Caudovirus prohead serine protease
MAALPSNVKFAGTTFARAVAAQIAGGFLHATSVGFRPLDFDFAKSASRKGGIDFKKQELLEVSIVPIPANSSCLLTGITGAEGKSLHLPSVRARGDSHDIVGAKNPISRQHILQGVFEVDSPITFRGCPMPRSQLILH